MSCAQPVVIPASNSSEPPILNERSVLGWDGFTAAQLHRIVVDADDQVKRLNARLRSEKGRLMSALARVKNRIDAGSPVEDRETFEDYLVLVGVKLSKSDLKQLGVTDEK